MPRERPILFSAPMVRAILAGRKTQTRRVVKFREDPSFVWSAPRRVQASSVYEYMQQDGTDGDILATMRSVDCPYGKPGDRLWVRESALADPPINGSWCGDVEWAGTGKPWACVPHKFRDTKHVIYAATQQSCAHIRYKPSIHMPRWASRITLEITGVRVERLNDISDADVRAEGWTRQPEGDKFQWYRDLWNSINGAGSWAANPWVWVVEFKRLEAA